MIRTVAIHDIIVDNLCCIESRHLLHSLDLLSKHPSLCLPTAPLPKRFAFGDETETLELTVD